MERFPEDMVATLAAQQEKKAVNDMPECRQTVYSYLSTSLFPCHITSTDIRRQLPRGISQKTILDVMKELDQLEGISVVLLDNGSAVETTWEITLQK